MIADGLRADAVSWRYAADAPLVLDHVSLHLAPGDVVLLTGPSGCGKSTLALIMAGLHPGHDGTVTLDGQPLAELSAAERAGKIGVVFQNADLQFCMDTLRHELEFCLENQAADPARMDERIASIARLVGVTQLLDRQLHGLSGGEKQRASLACALVGGAQTLILDEPFSNLDPDGVHDMIAVLATIRESQPLSILAVDHRPDAWAPIASRQIALRPPFVPPKRQRPDRARRTPQRTVLAVRDADVRVGGHPRFMDRLRRRVPQDARRLFHIDELTLRAGEIVALMGPSGSGKSTFLRTLIRQYPPEGSYLLNDQPLGEIPSRRIGQHVGMVFQNPADQFIALTVAGDAAFAADDGADVPALLAAFRLGEAASRPPFTLSQGEQRRLAVLGMVVAGQSLLLLDEPTYGQDDASTTTMMTLIRQTAEARDLAVVMTTHDERVASLWADRIVRVRDGALVADPIEPDAEVLDA